MAVLQKQRVVIPIARLRMVGKLGGAVFVARFWNLKCLK